MRRFNDSWAYKLDYDKEIAADLAEIAQVERHVPLAAALTEEERAKGDYFLSVIAFLFADVSARAPLLGLTLSDVLDLSWVWDISRKEYPIEGDPAPGWYLRGGKLSDKLMKDLGGDYIMRNPELGLKKLKSRLARHRRNKVKFG